MKLDHAGYMCEVDYNQYLTGQLNNGYDQYAQYYYRRITAQPTEQDLIIEGPFQRVGYWSIVIYIDGGTILHEVKDFELDSANNPYIEGNKSVFAYDKPAAGAVVALADKSLDLPVKTDNKDIGTGPWRDTESGRVYFFLSDKLSLSWGEDIAPDGCSRGYFSAWPNISTIDGVNQFMILRYKLPTTFVRQTAPDTPDMVFGHYPSREVSISSTAIEGILPVEELLEFCGLLIVLC